ncbi:MAG: PadR family transcriptional regulator [Proteobacteria bacterium]|nr:PadR family transcriptional regulator [Pseudomonadota bacterium]MBU1585325.1 PadR family transcriptional regulator [Pseudomonadota bacterium]MBU2455493.1 PadR family transcriptional regulator [Pseudomonadota bacterium]MBU2631735.1 PadR family transcriptional regulator [Pseudomonadota bacterium]
MSAIDLVILGFIKKTPGSPYELAQKVEASRINKIVKIGSPTIYQNIKKMAKKEYLSSKTVREGEMPEKTNYTLTEKGEAYFLELMEQLSSNPGRIYFNFNGFMKNLMLLEKETGLKMLKNLKLFFYDTKEDLEKDIKDINSPSFEIKAILKQYHIMLKGMIQWIEEVIEDYKKE